MEVIIKASRERCPDSRHLLEVGHPGAHHSLQSPEVLQELAPLGRAESRNHLEHGLVIAAGALAPVARDREPVRLVANPLDQA